MVCVREKGRRMEASDSLGAIFLENIGLKELRVQGIIVQTSARKISIHVKQLFICQ